MRRAFIASLGLLLVLFLPSSGEAAQGRARVQASGDLTLWFGIQHEFDFEVRDNYDLDNGLTDGCTRAAVTGEDCSGTEPRMDGFVQQETRLIVQGSQSNIWRARVVLESDQAWSGEQLGNMGVERAFADIKLYDTPVYVRAGLFADRLDPFGLVYAEDDAGVKVYARHGNISWAVWWIKEDEVADDNGATSGRDGDQDYYMARVTLDFGAFQVSPALGFLRNRNTISDARFATGNTSVDSFGTAVHAFRSCADSGPFTTAGQSNMDGCAADENVVYPGIITRGTFGPVSFVGEVFGAFGEIGDDSAVDAQRNQDVAAYLVAADVGVKLGAWTAHGGIIWASGDDNPHDDDAEAWAPMAANSSLLGSRGILMDDTLDGLGIADDSITAEGDSPRARLYGLQPGMIVLFAGLKGRPTKKLRTDMNIAFFQWDMEKQWEYVDGMVTTVNCTPSQTANQQGVCSNSALTNAVANGSGLISTVDDEVGFEVNGQVTYDYNRHIRLTIAAAVFFPGDGAEVVAQCANFDQNGNSFRLDGSVQSGCGRNTGANAGGALIQSRHGIARADDEAVNIDVELLVEF
jgi:hypothetical protein